MSQFTDLLMTMRTRLDTQKLPGVNPWGDCQYKADNDGVCAIGALIPDEIYFEAQSCEETEIEELSLEFDNNVGRLLLGVYPWLTKNNVNDLRDIQMFHDKTYNEAISSASFSISFDLPIPEFVETAQYREAKKAILDHIDKVISNE